MAAVDRVPDLPSLRLLVDVAHHGSIGGAARAAGVTQQAASERLRSVESQVGFSVLRRGPRGSQLTEAGTVLVEWATRLLDLADEIEVALDGLRGDAARDLTVAASMTVAESLVPRWLVLLRRRQEAAGQVPTAVSLSALNTRHVVEEVLAGRAQVGFVEGVRAPAGVRWTTVDRDELVLVTVPGERLSRRRSALTPVEVSRLPLTSRESGSGTRDVVETALRAHGLEMAHPAVELTTATGVREAVRAGSAPAFLSRRVVERDLRSGELVLVPTTGLDLGRTFRAVWVGTATPPAGPVRDLVGIARSAG